MDPKIAELLNNALNITAEQDFFDEKKSPNEKRIASLRFMENMFLELAECAADGREDWEKFAAKHNAEDHPGISPAEDCVYLRAMWIMRISNVTSEIFTVLKLLAKRQLEI